MTAFFALIRKDLILFRSDRRALIVSLLLPILIGAFMGSLTGGMGKHSPIEVALVQQDAGPVGAKVAAGLKSDPNLHLTTMTLEQARQAVRKGDRSVAIVIPAGFGDAAGAAFFSSAAKPEIGLLYDPSKTAVLAMVQGMLTQQVMQVVSAEMFSGPAGERFSERSLRQLDQAASKDPDNVALRDMLESVHKFQLRRQNAAAGKDKPQHAGLSMPFTTRGEALASGPAGVEYNGYAHSFAGMSVQFILFMGIDMGISILLAHRTGVWSRLLAAPVTLNTVLLARAASAAIIAFGLLCVIFAAAVLVFGVHISSIAGFAGLALSFALLTASFGLLVAALGKTPEAARGIAVFATLVMVMLGGAWMPSFMFPAWMQTATLVMPTRWAVDGLDAVTWRGFGLDAVLPSIAVLLAFALVFGALAIWKFRSAQR